MREFVDVSCSWWLERENTAQIFTGTLRLKSEQNPAHSKHGVAYKKYVRFLWSNVLGGSWRCSYDPWLLDFVPDSFHALPTLTCWYRIIQDNYPSNFYFLSMKWTSKIFLSIFPGELPDWDLKLPSNMSIFWLNRAYKMAKNSFFESKSSHEREKERNLKRPRK